MSSTQMDFSPMVIDRKQNIASWPEGDIDQLAARDKNRYQKRKSAVIEYFQSDHSVEEISSRQRLSAVDSLEVMVARCCMLHEDGEPWGFRALVPGAKVIDASAHALSTSSDQQVEGAKAENVSTRAKRHSVNADAGTQAQVVTEEATREEDTSEHQAIASTKFTSLPETPIPSSMDEKAEPVVIRAKIDFSNEPAREAAEIFEDEVKQEDFPSAINGTEEIIADPEVAQEEFPTVGSEIEPVADVAIVQEEFPTTASTAEETVASADTTQQVEFPAPEREAEVVTEEVAQEDFPTVTRATEETTIDEDVEQAEFPSFVSAVEIANEDVEDDELIGEPTGKLSDLKSVPQSEAEDDELDADKTDELVPDVAETDTETEEVADEEAEAAEMDTVEVARVVVEERLNRVAATETIKVPAAMLDALEKADQELQARDEVVTVPEIVEGSVADRQLAIPSADVQELVETPASVDSEQARNEVAAIPTQTLEAWRRDTRQLTQAPNIKTPTQSLVEDSRYRITGSQVAIKHAVRRRWGKQGRQQKYRSWVRIISAAVIASILVILLIPLSVGLVGYNAYTNIKGVADDGVHNLLSLQTLVPADKNDLLSALNPQKLAAAKTNLQKAQGDFLQLQDMVDRPDIESLLQQFAPQYSNKLDMARHLVQVALDVTRMGQELIGVAQMGANILHGSSSLLSSSSTTPLLSADDINVVQAALVHAQYYIGDIQTQMKSVNLAEIPFGTATQKAQLTKYLNQIPQALSTINQVQGLIGPVAWLLGVGQARHFLVQTLDRAELRPSGGFEGQYGILTLQNGRMSPFTLKDITDLDYAENGAELQRLPPSQYSWMNFGNWGVRDANLSADYPTNAQLVTRVFQEEGGGPVDGDIQFTPVLIAQLLQVTGSIYVKEYHETITAQNLESKLHYYQQDYNAINVQRAKTGTSNASTRKAFTTLVGKLLLDRVHTLKIDQLMAFSKILLQDLKTRDLQVYFTNPEAEQWLVQNGYSGAMPQFTNGKDGFMVVQANISISKATQYVHSTFQDQVSLDAQGGATHHLTIKLNYDQKGPVYGFDTYTDYVRVYAPANAQFQSGDGFVDPSHSLCTPASTSTKKGTTTTTTTPVKSVGCGQYNSSYPSDGRYCSSGNYSLGTGYVAGKGFIPWPVYAPSGPTETHSDLAGYKMWGGLTQTPKNCDTTITLSWYVPHVVQHTPGQAPYQMIVGHQAGWPDTAQISIDASKLKGTKSVNYNKTINVDTLVALAPLPLPPSQQKPGSTPTPAVTPTATPKKP